MKKNEQKNRVLKFSENEIMGTMAVLSSLIERDHVAEEAWPEMVEEFSKVYFRLTQVADAICGFEQKPETVVKLMVIDGLGRLNDQYYQLKELVEDGLAEPVRG